ncbi:hypothetical protein D9M71_417760 [compost metagenome]
MHREVGDGQQWQVFITIHERFFDHRGNDDARRGGVCTVGLLTEVDIPWQCNVAPRCTGCRADDLLGLVGRQGRHIDAQVLHEQPGPGAACHDHARSPDGALLGHHIGDDARLGFQAPCGAVGVDAHTHFLGVLRHDKRCALGVQATGVFLETCNFPARGCTAQPLFEFIPLNDPSLEGVVRCYFPAFDIDPLSDVFQVFFIERNFDPALCAIASICTHFGIHLAPPLFGKMVQLERRIRHLVGHDLTIEPA